MAAFLTVLSLFLAVVLWVPYRTGLAIRALARRLSAENQRMGEVAAISGTAIAGIVLAIVGSFIGALIAMQVFADILPDYLTALGSVFTTIAAVNTTGWPPIVATIFGFLDLILGVVAIAALFSAGALFVIEFRKNRAA